MLNRALSRKGRHALALGALAAGLVFVPDLAWSAEEMLTQTHGNILWTLVAAILVMLMQAGFAMVECGLTRAKNAGNILMKNYVDFAAGGIAFFLFGFALMFGTDVGGFIGASGFALGDATAADADGQWTMTFWFFQSVFAATAATIVSGCIAERTKFSAYIVMSVIITGLIYPVSGHWMWGSLWLGDAGAGWLEGLGFMDFAGSTVVHSVGAWIGLAGAMVIGPRAGKYSADGTPNAIPGHSIPLAGLGVFLLWFGWFGFNPGSTTTADGSIGYIAVNTTLSAAAGTMGAMAISWLRYGKPDISMTMNGALAGLVGITAGCYDVAPIGAIVIGLTSGMICVYSIEFFDRVLKVDDPVGAISVHGACGAWGTLMVAFFAAPGFGGDSAGLFYGGGAGQILTQLIGIASAFVWAFGMGYLAFSAIKVVMGVRVSKEEELKGLDIGEHGMEAYNGFQVFTVE